MTRIRFDLVFFASLLLLLFASMLHNTAFAAQQQDFTLTSKQVVAQIADRLAQMGAGDKVNATLNNHLSSVIIRHDAPITVEVSGLDFDAETRKWNAQMRISSEGVILQETQENGRFTPIVSVPVLSKRLNSKDVITDLDIAWKDVPENQLRKDTILDADTLLGKSPLRVIAKNRPVRGHEVSEPMLMEKGDTVQVYFTKGALHIRAMGEAREDGAYGDIIPVRNVDSGTIIQARILSAGEAEVVQFNRISSNSYR